MRHTYLIVRAGEQHPEEAEYDTLREAYRAADAGDQIIEYEYEFTDSSLVGTKGEDLTDIMWWRL